MSRRWKLAVLAAALPAAAGLLAWWAYLGAGWLPDNVLYFRASLAYLLLGAGVLVSLILAAGLALAWLQQRRASAAVQNAQAEAAERRRQFLRRLDHELKNPLTILQVEAAGLDPGLPAAEQAQGQQRLREQAQRLNDLVVQLRKLAELETRPIENEPVDLAELLRELVDEVCQGLPEPRRIDLNIPSVPWPLPNIRGDADLLYLAIRNVLTNSIKFTRPEAAIQVRAFENDRHVSVEVADTGAGIPEDEQPFVWEELFRGQSARSTPGSGLGLALVKAVVERHGGETSLRSRAGQGTVVTLRFPIPV